MAKAQHNPFLLNQTHKVCSKCGLDKLAEEFHLRNDGRKHQTRRRECRECRAATARKYAAEHPELIAKGQRRAKLRRNFGMTPEDYQSMWDEQDGKCLLCGKDETEAHRRMLPVDHCHTTGRVRGLLCGLCNRQLGWVESVGLDRIVAYLK